MKKIIGIIMLVVFLIPANSFAADNVLLDIGLTRVMNGSDVVELNSNDYLALYDNEGLFIKELDARSIRIVSGNREFQIYNGDYLIEEIYNDDVIIIGSHNNNSTISIRGNEYRGFIKLKRHNSKLLIINRVRLEDYLRGVVPVEMSSSSHKEALMAQSIASRSFALANINKMAKKGYNLDDTTSSQVYHGKKKEHELTDFAIRETEGIVAKYNGEIANTIFFSTSSGWTENAKDVWGGDRPYLQSVKDEYSVGTSSYNWNVNTSNEELTKILQNNGYNINEIRGISLETNGVTGNVKNIIIKGNNGDFSIKASNFRNIMGTIKFRSTNFSLGGMVEASFMPESNDFKGMDGMLSVIDGSGRISKLIENKQLVAINGFGESTKVNHFDNILVLTNKGITSGPSNKANSNKQGVESVGYQAEYNFIGRGFGHGVGMSQAGAQVMAKQGFNFEEILKFYYSGIDVGR